MNDQEAEKVLLRLAKAREDSDAWEALYRRFRPFVYALAFRRTGGSRDLAKEATQEVFFRLVKYCPFEKLTEANHFRSYLAIMTRNVVAVLRRHPEGGFLRDSSSELEESGYMPAEEVFELRQLLMQALGELPEEDRRTLALRLEGYSLKEAAERLGTSAGTVAVRLHRIRARLRRHPALKDLI